MRARKLLFAGILLFGLLASVEAAAWLALRLQTGRTPTPAWRETERARAAGEAGEGVEARGGGRRRRRLADAFRREVLHPYLGFVLDPHAPLDDWLRVTPEGFTAVPLEPPAPAGRFTVAIFGGSLAQQLALAGRRTLVRELQRVPRLTGRRPVWVETFALGGYKQPQQLMTLAYLLARGDAPELVINVDGFNDVVLPVAENLRDGVHPVYPRGWALRVAGVPDLEAQRLVGEIAYLGDRRRARAEFAGRAPQRWSAACHLVWRSLDRRSARRIAALQAAVAARGAEERSFLTGGPAFRPPSDEPALYRELAAVWRRSSEAMDALCRSRGIPYFHFLQPNQYLRDAKPMSREERQAALDPAHPYRPSVLAGYPYLREAGAELARAGVPFHDLTGVFADRAEPLYGDTCCHLNRRGYELLAAEIGRIIRAQPYPRRDGSRRPEPAAAGAAPPSGDGG